MIDEKYPQKCKKEEPVGNCNNWASRLLELYELCQMIYDVSGFTPGTILEMFRMGYTLEAPDNKEHPWDKMTRLATDD